MKTREDLLEEMATKIVDDTEWEDLESFYFQHNYELFDNLLHKDLLVQAELIGVDISMGVEE